MKEESKLQKGIKLELTIYDKIMKYMCQGMLLYLITALLYANFKHDPEIMFHLENQCRETVTTLDIQD